MFKCKICAEKDRRISDLKDQIATLKRLTIPTNDPKNIPILSLEADAILSGHQDTITIDESELPADATDEILAERDRILSGTYN